MAISSVGSAGAASQPTLNSQSQQTDPAQAFLAYMNETPAQRMEDSWLAQHGITKKEFDAMSPEKRNALLKQMAQDIAQKLKDQAQNGAQKTKEAGL